MARWQLRAIYAALAVVVGLFLIEAGFTAFLLIGAFSLLGIGFWAGWNARADDEIARWIYRLQPPPDDPPEKIRT